MTTKAKATDGPTTDASVNEQIKDASGVSMADASALNGVQPTGQRSAEQDATDEVRRRVNDPDAKPFISEGMRHDLEIHGSANDPVTGRKLTMDRETGKVTAHAR